jgi:uncharacterized protein
MNSANEEATPGRPAITILVFAGMTASGKSTLGQALARKYRAPYYNTDRIRKELAGLQVTERRPDQLGSGIYTTAHTETTYQTMLDRAQNDAALGAEIVIFDGSYSTRRYRDAVRKVAQDLGGSAVFIFCFCSDEEVRRRLEQRLEDSEAVSDGRWEIYVHQKETFEFPDVLEKGPYILLDTQQAVEKLVTDLQTHPFLRDLLPAR